MTDEVRSALESGILTLTIHRPDQRNALNQAVLKGLGEAFRQAAGNRAVRVVTLTGAGDKVFCAGADLKSSLPQGLGGDAFSRSDYRELLMEILRCPKPTIALARGHVMAGGMGILLACDLALACDDVHFSTPEIQVGMFPMMVLALLYGHVGRKKATEMLFLGERMAAGAAMELGIVNHVYPRDRFEIEAGELVRKLADTSGSILRLGKEAILRVEGRTLREDLAYLESALARVMSCADSREGMSAFVEKRKPQWKDE
ncbi:MAG: enoyl-CoA hydratase/isomerase family protein [Acidobacteriia bacterium]|nr:enoyl-CoA hydratase/isomerase family protein [Terriglobia bacterium]